MYDLQDFTYEYDASNNVTRITDAIASHASDRRYIYDGLDRLIHAGDLTADGNGSYVCASGDCQSFAYDSLGNRTSISGEFNPFGDGSVVVVDKSYDYGEAGFGPHQLSSVTDNLGSDDATYVYDEVGNVEQAVGSEATFDFTYDSSSRLTVVEKDGVPVIENVYGFGSNRIYRKETFEGGSTAERYYLGGAYELNNGALMKYYFANGRRIARLNGTVLRYFLPDHLQSTSVLTSTAGTQVQHNDYYPFGSFKSRSGFPALRKNEDHLYTDQVFDETAELYHYGARYYDPVIGRFLSPDAYPGSTRMPQTLNPYSYVQNNPMKRVDPSGNFSLPTETFEKREKPFLIYVTGGYIQSSGPKLYGGDPIKDWRNQVDNVQGFSGVKGFSSSWGIFEWAKDKKQSLEELTAEGLAKAVNGAKGPVVVITGLGYADDAAQIIKMAEDGDFHLDTVIITMKAPPELKERLAEWLLDQVPDPTGVVKPGSALYRALDEALGPFAYVSDAADRVVFVINNGDGTFTIWEIVNTEEGRMLVGPKTVRVRDQVPTAETWEGVHQAVPRRGIR